MAKDNQCYLRKNKERKTDTHPEYKGSGTVDGTEHWLAAWVNTDDQTKEKYFTIKFTPKEQQKPKEAPKSRQPGEDDEPFDDDIPF